MAHVSHSSAPRSEEFSLFGAKPVFITGWWKELKTLERCFLLMFVVVSAVGLLIFCGSITHDLYFEHTLKLVGIRPEGFPDQAIKYNLSLTIGVGFWSNIDRQSTNYRHQDLSPGILTILQQHMRVASDLWTECATRQHRASACSQSSFMLFTLSLTGLFSAYFTALFNRRVMIYMSMGSAFVMASSFALLYASSLEYNNCVVDRQVIYSTETEFEFVSYRGRYFAPTMKTNNVPLIGVLVAYLLGFIPMTAFGAILICYGTEKL
ncbi:hypothetical protein CRM22_007349 [Opisthorchis felineus]|uniref:Uncharacterized protein n=1 Tax=Opisthorchis felineus TaxID=147828 RepID=A0A4S2LGI0_OPIFE|nr:hypothetical protein CRM22_007349 [Opisthorchis felineus]